MEMLLLYCEFCRLAYRSHIKYTNCIELIWLLLMHWIAFNFVTRTFVPIHRTIRVWFYQKKRREKKQYKQKANSFHTHTARELSKNIVKCNTSFPFKSIDAKKKKKRCRQLWFSSSINNIFLATILLCFRKNEKRNLIRCYNKLARCNWWCVVVVAVNSNNKK